VRLRWLAALGLTLAAGFGCSGGDSDEEQFDTAKILGRAGPAPWSGTGVLRASWDGGRIVEWLDRRTGATRSVDYGGNGAYVRIQNGRWTMSWSVFDGRASPGSLSEVADPRDPRLEHGSEILSYWRKLRRGAARIIGEGELDGRPIWIVDVEPARGGDAPSDLNILAELDRSTFLPLRVRTESEEESEYTSTRTVVYSDAPNADRRALFSFDRPTRNRGRTLRYRDLADVPFPVYAPGPRAGDLIYSPASTYQEVDGRQTLFLSYVRGTDPFAEPAITLGQSRAPAGRRFPRRGEFVQIDGAPTRVHLTRDGQIWVTIGDTLIHGRTTLPREETMRFLRALRRAR
jgi:hypothetical protein